MKQKRGNAKLTPAQLIALQRCLDDGQLVRVAGGFWTTRGVASSLDYESGEPFWWCSAGTIKALERRGMLTVYPPTVYDYPRRPRQVTQAGIDALRAAGLELSSS